MTPTHDLERRYPDLLDGATDPALWRAVGDLDLAYCPVAATLPGAAAPPPVEWLTLLDQAVPSTLPAERRRPRARPASSPPGHWRGGWLAQAWSLALLALTVGALLSVLRPATPGRAPAVLATLSLGQMANNLQLAVAPHAGRAFVTGQHGDVRVISTATGRLLHTTYVGGQPADMAVDDRRHRVVVVSHANTTAAPGGSGGVVSILDATTGRVVSAVALDGPNTGVALDERAGRALVTTELFAGGLSVSLLETSSGRLLHTTVIEPPAVPKTEGSIAVGAGSAFVVPATGRAFLPSSLGMRLLDTHSGALLATLPITEATLTLDPATGHLFALFSSGQQTRITRLDPRTGAALHTTSLAGAVVSLGGQQPLACCYLATYSDPVRSQPFEVRSFDPRTGNPLTRTPIEADALPVLALDHRAGRLLAVQFSTTRATAYLLDARTGARLAVIPALAAPVGAGWPTLPVAAVDQQAGLFYVASPGPAVGLVEGRSAHSGLSIGPGEITVVNALTGAVVGRVHVGVAPQLMAIDERTGHLFVVNAGGPVRGPASSIQMAPASLSVLSVGR